MYCDSIDSLATLLGATLVVCLVVLAVRVTPPEKPKAPPKSFPAEPALVSAKVEQEFQDLKGVVATVIHGDVKPLIEPSERRILAKIRDYEKQVAKFAEAARKAGGF